MTQKGQPKAIYVMESEIGLVKLGISENPGARMRTIQGASGIRLELVHSSEHRLDAKAVEFAAHHLLREKRKTGEWFDVTAEEAIQAIKSASEAIERERVNKRRRGRPKCGRLTMYQTGLDDEESIEIERIVLQEGSTTSAVLRDLVVEAIAARKRKARK